MAKFAKVLVTNVKKLWKVESSTILTFKVKRLKEFFSIFSLKNIEKGEQLLILSFFDIFDFQCSVFPHLRPAGNIISHSLQMRVLLENTTNFANFLFFIFFKRAKAQQDWTSDSRRFGVRSFK